MKKIHRILVAVKDADAKTLPAVDKAAQLARAFGADLELFHGITERLSAGAAYFQEGGLVGVERALRAHYHDKLEALAQRLRDTGLKVNATTEWDFPVYEAVVRQARRMKADLIVAECHAGRRLAPWLLHVTDWELLRTSPVPVLLVKNAKPYRNPVVLAALDPSHAFAKPAQLDGAILGTAEQLTHALSGSLHAMHAYDTGSARKSFDRAVNGKVSRARQHLVNDVPVDAIPATAKETGAALVVMGAISRSGLKRVLIGNTAEQVLNELTCDALVVKPKSFVTRVSRIGRGARITASPAFPGPY
jgi:universal stress protein E